LLPPPAPFSYSVLLLLVKPLAFAFYAGLTSPKELLGVEIKSPGRKETFLYPRQERCVTHMVSSITALGETLMGQVEA
jgi:hypothetical protein